MVIKCICQIVITGQALLLFFLCCILCSYVVFCMFLMFEHFPIALCIELCGRAGVIMPRL